MWLANKCRAADGWLLETKFQKWSEGLYDHLGLSMLRSAQICFAVATGVVGAAYVHSVPQSRICWYLTVGSGCIVLLLEILEFIRRKVGDQSGDALDMSDVVTPNIRIAYIVLMFFIAVFSLLSRSANVPSAQTLEPALVLSGIIAMVFGLYFLSCKGKPRKPIDAPSLEFVKN